MLILTVKIPSEYLDKAVNQLAGLPGIGRRTALRLALFLYDKPTVEIEDFTDSIKSLKTHTKRCQTCHSLCDSTLCNICLNPNREKGVICVVEEIQDVMAIESTSVFKGSYHVLGGLISPIDGISPSDLSINTLLSRIENTKVHEIIFALSPTMEGDTTAYYLFKKLKEQDILITVLSRGVSIGAELQYTDELSLSKSLEQRLPYFDQD